MNKPADARQEIREEPESDEAKLFWNGRSQAVRLPKEYRFKGDKVHIRRVEGGVLLESIPTQKTGVQALRAGFGRIDEILGDTPFPEREDPSPAPIREYFD